MTEDQLFEDNPWKEVADLYNPQEMNCLFRNDDIWYACDGDKEAIKKYNDVIDNAAKNAEGSKRIEILKDRIVTNIPAEPWWGNPLKARLIILSLNPGYVPEVNKTLALLMQTNEAVRRQLIEYKAKTLRLEAESFLPEEEDIPDCPITCNEAVNMLGDWYWVKMLKQLKMESKLSDKDFYRRIALVEYHGYSSQTSGRVFPRKGDKLKSQEFLKNMLWYIGENRRDDVCFLVMRAKKEWMKLLSKKFFDDFNVVEKKSSSMISQYITPANFENEQYKKIKDVFE